MSWIPEPYGGRYRVKVGGDPLTVREMRMWLFGFLLGAAIGATTVLLYYGLRR